MNVRVLLVCRGQRGACQGAGAAQVAQGGCGGSCCSCSARAAPAPGAWERPARGQVQFASVGVRNGNVPRCGLRSYSCCSCRDCPPSLGLAHGLPGLRCSLVVSSISEPQHAEHTQRCKHPRIVSSAVQGVITSIARWAAAWSSQRVCCRLRQLALGCILISSMLAWSVAACKALAAVQAQARQAEPGLRRECRCA